MNKDRIWRPMRGNILALDAVEISDVAGRSIHHKRHCVARLFLFAFQSVWRVRNATVLYLLHHVCGDHLEQILFLR